MIEARKSFYYFYKFKKGEKDNGKIKRDNVLQECTEVFE